MSGTPIAVAFDHNCLSGLQGGAAGEYYHLDSADYTELTAWLDDVTLSDGGDLTTPGLTKTGTLTITAPSAQPYAFSSRSTDFLTLQGQTSAKNTNFELFNKDGDNSDSTQIFLWSQGTPSSIANASALFIQNVGSAQCQIATYKAGASGIFKDLIIFTSGNANQLYLDQGTGYVGIGKAPSLGTIDVNGNCSALSYSIGAVTGYNGTFTEHTGKTVTVTNGIVTSVV